MMLSKSSVLTLILLCNFLAYHPADTAVSAATVISIAGLVKNVVRFGLDLINAIQAQGRDAEEIVPSNIVDEINVMIEKSTTKTITSMLGISKLERIDDAVIAVHSSMIDVRNIITAEDLSNKKIYEDQFVKFYEETEVIKHVRFLPEILFYSIPGFEVELLPHLMDKTRCNLTALMEFGDFFLNLVSDGIALQAVYFQLKNGIGPESFINDEWDGGLKKIQTIFEHVTDKCVEQFEDLAYEDFLSATNASTLGNNNAERYIYNWSDAVFYAPLGTFQFHFLKYVSDRLLFFQKTNDQNKIAVYGSRQENGKVNVTLVENILDNAGFSVPSEDDQEAAQHVGEAVEKKLREYSYSNIEVISVFFDGPDFSQRGYYRDKDSTVITFTMTNVTLTYCYELAIVCSWKNMFKTKETAHGSFKVHPIVLGR